MRTMKTSEATDMVLNWLVATCEGYTNLHMKELKGCDPVVRVLAMDAPYGWVELSERNYTSDWAQGGPIIEREGIELLCESLGFRWVAIPQKGPEWRGTTPLIAAMRCYVASKLGDEVEIPEELK